MKATRRHELKENVLAHELVKLKSGLSKYGSWIFVAVLLVGIAVVVVVQLRARTERQRAAEKADLNRLTGADPDLAAEERLAGLMRLAAEAKDPVVGAQAGVTAGNNYLTRYNVASDRSSKESRGFLDQAKSAFQLVLDRRGDQELFAAQAHFGLGSLAETLGDFAAAKGHYETAAGMVDETEQVAKNARAQIEKLPTLATSVPFATTRPAEPPTTGPATTAPAATGPATKPSASGPATKPAGAGPATAPAKAGGAK